MESKIRYLPLLFSIQSRNYSQTTQSTSWHDYYLTFWVWLWLSYWLAISQGHAYKLNLSKRLFNAKCAFIAIYTGRYEFRFKSYCWKIVMVFLRWCQQWLSPVIETTSNALFSTVDQWNHLSKMNYTSYFSADCLSK